MLAALFVAASTTMLLLPEFLPTDVDRVSESLLDALLLTLVVAPILWMLLVRPVRRLEEFRTEMNAGACGSVVKTVADSELLSAIRAVHHGRMFVSMPSQKPEDLLTPVPSDSAKPLSDREQQVPFGLAKGNTNKEIGEQIHLRRKTIETDRARIAAKRQLRM